MATIEEMLDSPRDGAFEPGWHDKVSEPIGVTSVDAWRGRLQPRQVALVEHVAGPLLERFGYLRDTGLEVAPSAEDLRAVAWERRRRAARWRRYALCERKRRRITYRRPVAARPPEP